MTDIEPEGSVVTEGKLLGPEYLITLEWKRSTGIPPKAVCSCGNFETEPSTNMIALGLKAFAHRAETGHALRQHVESSLFDE